jgi:hypothetical protein
MTRGRIVDLVDSSGPPAAFLLIDSGVANLLVAFESVTAKKTANPMVDDGRRRTAVDCRGKGSNVAGLRQTVMDASPAVFKTVCGRPP